MFDAVELIKQRRYEEVRPLYRGFAPVKNKYGKWGYVDKNGKEVIACKFDVAEQFEKNGEKAQVQKDGVWMYVNKEGKLVSEDGIKNSMIENEEKSI